ncbi:sensor histidine kinase [Streptomyces jeddahensis]|nr:sensor histidine kinase [Streptomyces jeddahensis]
MVREWVGRVLRAARDDLWTFGADPLPPSVWLRWLPHGLVCLTAFGVTVADVQQLDEYWRLGTEYALLVGIVQGASVVLALWRPVPAWWLSTAAMVVGAVGARGRLMSGAVTGDPSWPWNPPGVVGHAVVLLLLALRVRTRITAEVLALTALVTYVLQGLLGAAAYESTGVLAVTLFCVVVVLGTALRGRRVARTQLLEQTTLTAEERARRTLLEERSRIARELHDVVAHHMSVISIQAQVAPHLVKDPPEELKENLEGIRQNALEALTELRRVLGVLRSEHPGDPGGSGTDDTAPHAPQPTLNRLDALVENTRAAGLAVTTEVTGPPRALAPGVELSAYRIVQEALSNALRHAPGSAVRVELAHTASGLRLRVANTAPDRPASPSPSPSPGAGHGLLGMRERAAMLGGGLTAGPTPDGGYEVTAFLPASAPPPLDETPKDGV